MLPERRVTHLVERQLWGLQICNILLLSLIPDMQWVRRHEIELYLFCMYFTYTNLSIYFGVYGFKSFLEAVKCGYFNWDFDLWGSARPRDFRVRPFGSGSLTELLGKIGWSLVFFLVQLLCHPSWKSFKYSCKRTAAILSTLAFFWVWSLGEAPSWEMMRSFPRMLPDFKHHCFLVDIHSLS